MFIYLTIHLPACLPLYLPTYLSTLLCYADSPSNYKQENTMQHSIGNIDSMQNTLVYIISYLALPKHLFTEAADTDYTQRQAFWATVYY